MPASGSRRSRSPAGIGRPSGLLLVRAGPRTACRSRLTSQGTRWPAVLSAPGRSVLNPGADWKEMAMSTPAPVTGQRAELLQALDEQRGLLRGTTRGLTGEQAARRTTVSELCLGGLIKH